MLRYILLVTLAASALAFVEPQLDYHDSVGIPLAKSIREAEEKLQANQDIAPNSGRIVGGVIAMAAQHPYLGGLVIDLVNVVGNSACGSSLLSMNRLVTAAHCWISTRQQAWRFTVVLGSQYLFFGGTHRIPTSSVVMHPQYNMQTLANDVAMIYLPTNVVFSQAVQPISLPSGNQLWDSFAGNWAMASGFGKTLDSVDLNTMTQVSHVTLQVITVQACQQVYGSAQVLASNICTNGAGGVGICGGDSGGPLVVNQNGQNILVGISSFVAAAGCQLGHPSAFARVTSFQSFITQHLW